ncbi:uncharacterized protein EAF01_011853 [Botrytis porri]|uniref:uncharacterized protein n=1 Tax=Botrytis porri TaxID=87229 RepID=UPI00190267FD|nr:uncharacterized protein EAF01_011853 [Botrytis porri]KAF7881342.1 hypothetical protein EAF01_011853 [Botrytis porri]
MSTSFDLGFAVGEPIICLNTSCNYPFGRICSECSIEFEARAALQAQSQAESQAQSKTNPNPNSDSKNRVPKTQSHPAPSRSRSTTIQSRSRDISERVADIVEDLQGIFAFVPVTSTVAAASSAAAAVPAALPPKPTPHTPPPPPPNPLNASVLNIWLNDIVLRTLEGEILSPSSTGDTFTGGAEEEDTLDTMCPYCDGSMGEGAWRELHLIQCRYAHVEKERLEIAMGKKG